MLDRALCPTLVGRARELDLLEDVLLDVGLGEGRVVALSGYAGLGKTRLAAELASQAAKLGCAVLRGECAEAELEVPYLPFLEAIGTHLAVIPDLEPLRQRLGAGAGALARVFPQFGGETGEVGDDATHAKLRFFEAVVTLIASLATTRPLLLVIEDLHWADPSTHELVDYVARRVRGLHVLLLVTYRREEMDRSHRFEPTLQGWRRAHLVDEIELGPLDRARVAHMVCAIFGEAAISGEFQEYLHDRTEGIPFVVEEMLKEAMDGGDIFRTEAGWERRTIADMRIPATVREAILRRVERMGSVEARVLRHAAVIGASFDFDVLADVCGDDDATLETVLEGCVRHQLLGEIEGTPGGFRFRHSLTWEAVYGDIPRRQRARLHAVVAGALEKGGGSFAERARHLAAAGRVAEAVPLWIAGAEVAAGRHAHVDAAGLLSLALPHVDDPQARARLHCSLGDAQYASGPEYWPSAVASLEAGLSTRGLLDEREAARSQLRLGHCYQMLERHAEARDQFDRARMALARGGASEDLAMVYLRQANLDFFEGRWESAERLAHRAIATATDAQADVPRIWAQLTLAVTIAETGRTDELLILHERAMSEARERDLVMIHGNALNNHIGAMFDLCRARDALPFVAEMLSTPSGIFRHEALFFDGYVHAHLGDLEHARLAFVRYVEGAPHARNMRIAPNCLAWVLCELDRTPEARSHVEQPDTGARWQVAVWETLTWMQFHVAAGTPAEAVPAIDALLERFGGLPPGMVHGIPLLADLTVATYAATGDTGRADAIAGETQARGLTWSPWGQRAVARARLHAGDGESAVPLLGAVATRFAAGGHRMDEIETRLLLGDALVATGEVAAAVTELRTALALAQRSRALRRAAAAQAKLAAAGDTTDTVEVSGHPTSMGARAAFSVAGPGRDGAPHSVAIFVAELSGVPASAAAGDDVTEPISAVQRWAARAVQRQGGIVDIAGTTVTATFDSGSADADRAVETLQSALMLSDKAVLAGVTLAVGVAFAADVGGRPLAGGSHRVADVARELAARAPVHAVAGEVLISEEAFRRTRDWLEERDASAVARRLTLEGCSEAAIVYGIGRPLANRPPTPSRPVPISTPPENVGAQGDPDPAGRVNVFQRSGEYWTVEYHGRVVRLRDSKGLGDLATLLARPGREIPALELVAVRTARVPVSAAGPTTRDMSAEGDIGPALDAEATRQYRERLVDLEEEISSAEADNDPETASRAREEREFLLAELGTAFGLGGHRRPQLDPAERARKAVTWRIRDAISRISAADRAVGEHFRRSVRTGAFCAYDPPDGTTWVC